MHKLASDSYRFEVNAIPFSGNTFRQTTYFSTSIKILHSIDETSTHMQGFTLIRRRLEVLLLLGFVILLVGLAWKPFDSAAGFCFITLFAAANLLWLVAAWLYFADYYQDEMMSLIQEKFLPLSNEDEY